MFNVGPLSFEVLRAEIKLFAGDDDDSICWGIAVVGDRREDSRGMVWKPAILGSAIAETARQQLSSVRELAGIGGSWSTPPEDPNLFLEVYEVCPLYDCRWSFCAGTGAFGLDFTLEGHANVDVENMKVPVSLRTPVRVAPWPMARLVEAECLEIYKRIGLSDPVAFKTLEHGVSSLVFLNQ